MTTLTWQNLLTSLMLRNEKLKFCQDTSYIFRIHGKTITSILAKFTINSTNQSISD